MFSLAGAPGPHETDAGVKLPMQSKSLAKHKAMFIVYIVNNK